MVAAAAQQGRRASRGPGSAHSATQAAVSACRKSAVEAAVHRRVCSREHQGARSPKHGAPQRQESAPLQRPDAAVAGTS